MNNLPKKILLSLLTGALVFSFAVPGLAAHNRGPWYPEENGSSSNRPAHRSSASRPSNRPPMSSRPSGIHRPTGMQRPSGPPPNRPPMNSRPNNVQQRPSGAHRPTGMQRPSGSPPNRPPMNSRPNGFNRPPDRNPNWGHGPARPGYNHKPPYHSSPHHRPNHPPRYEHPYRDWRHNHFIFDFGWPRSYYWWSTNHNVYFGDYLLLVLILQGIQKNNAQITMDNLYGQHNSGLSYEEICNRYNLNWTDIYARARLGYNDMHFYAVGHGLDFWGWNEHLNW